MSNCTNIIVKRKPVTAYTMLSSPRKKQNTLSVPMDHPVESLTTDHRWVTGGQHGWCGHEYQASKISLLQGYHSHHLVCPGIVGAREECVGGCRGRGGAG